MPAFLRKLLRAGVLPAELRRELESEDVVGIAENLVVVRRFSGSVPGLFSSSSTSRTAGAVAFTARRVVVTMAVQSDAAAVAVDHRWDATEPGAMTVEITGDGVHLTLDVGRVDPRFTGQLTLHFRYDVPGDVLSRLPETSVRQDVSSDFVYRALGVRAPKPPKS